MTNVSDALYGLVFNKSYRTADEFFLNRSGDGKDTLLNTSTSIIIDNSYYYVIYICYPILLTCCTGGNVINLIVFRYEKRKGPTNTYLTVVAVSDLCALWLYFPTYLYNVSEQIRHNPTFKTSFDNFHGIQVWCQETAMLLGDGILIIFSLMRLLAIVSPFRFLWLQTSQSARLLACLQLFLAAIFNLNYCVRLYYPLTHSCDSDMPIWLTRWNRLQDQAEMVNTFLKFLALMIINGTMISVIHRQLTTTHAITRHGQSANSARKYRYSNILLLGSVALYLVTQLPNMVYKGLIIAADDYHSMVLTKQTRRYIGPFTLTAALINYSINFFLYATSSRRFRRQFLLAFGGLWCCRKLLKLNVNGITGKRTSTQRTTYESPDSLPMGSMDQKSRKSIAPAVANLHFIGSPKCVTITRRETELGVT